MPQNPPSPEDVNLPLPGEAVQDMEAGLHSVHPQVCDPDRKEDRNACHSYSRGHCDIEGLASIEYMFLPP